MRLQQKLPRRVLATLAVCLACSCAGAPPARTLQLRAFLGATEDGAWAFAEVNEFPGSPARGKVHLIGPDSKARSTADVPAAAVAEAVWRAAEAGETEARTAERTLTGLRPEGFDPARAALQPLPVGGAGIPVPLPVPAELALRREDGELRLAVRLAPGGEEDLVAYRLPSAGTTWIGGVRLLPGARRALVETGAATSSRTEVHRLEGLGEVDLAGAVAALLDSRAVRRIEAGSLEQATDDLQRAVALAPDDSTAHYNLACAHALAGALDEALVSLGRAVDLDPERLKPLALSDPDLEALRDRVEFRLMVEPRAPGTTP